MDLLIVFKIISLYQKKVSYGFFFIDMYLLAFFDIFGVFLSGESFAANEKLESHFFRCKPDLSTHTKRNICLWHMLRLY